MSMHTRLRAALPKRGAVSRFNDNTMEYLIALARLGAVLAALGTLGSAVGWIWTDDYRWPLSGALAGLVAGAATWFGYIENGNEEWRGSGKTN